MNTKELEKVSSQRKHEKKDLKMEITQKVCCPNCGSKCERNYILESQICRTSCDNCDYLMINCTRTGKVIEAYAPGIYAR